MYNNLYVCWQRLMSHCGEPHQADGGDRNLASTKTVFSSFLKQGIRKLL